MTKARDIADFKFENIVDTGTEGTKVASGTSAQRGSTAGQIRFNTTTNLAEYYDGTIFKNIDSPPTVTSIDDTEVDSQAGGNQTIVITGTNFQSGATVNFVGNAGTDFNATTVTVDSATQITAVAPKSSFLNAQEPYGVRVVNSNGLSGTLDNQINVDNSPTWSTASGTIATINDNDTGTHVTVSATDVDGDTVAYSETGGTVLSTNNLTLNSSTGAISGDPVNVVSPTTHSFTLRATANSKTADRNFNIVVNPAPFNIHYLVIAGGGGGGSNTGNYENGGGGGAGGFREDTAFQVAHATNYTVTVGAGGSAYNAGSNSVFSTITSLGGGGGGGSSPILADNGGSGGGGTAWGSSGQFGYGTYSGSSGGGIYDSSPRQGYDGGAGSTGVASTGGAGAGGGAGGAGGAASGQTGGNGGAGKASSITGSSVTYAGGGGGWGNGGSYGAAGSGGAGAGQGHNAQANTGSGGGGHRGGTGGSGGSGIVILKYPDTKTLTIGAGLTYSTSTAVSGYKITSFTAGTGTVSF